MAQETVRGTISTDLNAIKHSPTVLYYVMLNYFRSYGCQATNSALNLNAIPGPFLMVTNSCKNFTFHEIILVVRRQYLNHPVICHGSICCQHFYRFPTERSIPADKA